MIRYLLRETLYGVDSIRFSNATILLLTAHQKTVRCRGDSAALGQRMPWANRLFLKSMKGIFLLFLHKVEKMISVISVQV